MGTMENGLIEFTIPKGGRYKIVQKSRSSNRSNGPAMGVTIELHSDYKKGEKLFIFVADSIFLFDVNKKLISVPGAAGWCGNYLYNGSVTTELQNCDQYYGEILGDGYDTESVLNGDNRTQSANGSGYKNGKKYGSGGDRQGGSTFVDSRYKSTIKQTEEIPPTNSFTV